MSDAIKPVRRIVTIDDEDGKSVAIADGPPPDVQTDPARPGFASARIWVTDASPAQIGPFRDAALVYPRALEPPPGGSVCRVVTLPPDGTFRGNVGRAMFLRLTPHSVIQRTTGAIFLSRQRNFRRPLGLFIA